LVLVVWRADYKTRKEVNMETLIEIKQDRRGFDGFIGSWLYQDDLTLLVDVGPANTSGRLMEGLAALHADRIDYILLTHIHLDHAGALADVLARYPMARVICHEKGAANLVDPARLWRGSLKVLGEIAESYGKPKPVPLDRIVPHTRAQARGVTVIETPGHAQHHLSFSCGKRLFPGEAAGTFMMVGGEEYLRPATPPRFFLEVFLESVDRLLALEDQPIFYAHFGQAQSSHVMLKRFRAQVLSWKGWIQQEIDLGGEDLERRCVEALLSKDQNLAGLEKMDGPTQEREHHFIGNAVKGFLGFFSETSR
jgi:glyoxylase-like metal-dependent hydrolase (beta-lactamase superfamily II)